MDNNKKSPVDYFTPDSFIGGDDISLETIEPKPIEEEEIEDELEVEEEEEDESHDPVYIDGEDPEEEEEEEEEEDDEDYDNPGTRAYIFAKEFVKDGSLPSDFEFDKDLTGADLKAALYKEAVGKLDIETYAKSKGYTDEVWKVANAIVNGTHPDLAFEVNQYEAIASVDVDEHDEYSEEILKLYYSDKGIDESTAEDIISNKMADGSDKTEAKKAQKYFLEKAQKIRQEQKNKIEERNRKIKEYKEEVASKINSGVIGDLKIDKKESKELLDYMYKETEPETVMIDGKPHKIMVSKFKKDYDSHKKDTESFIRFAYNMKHGFDVKKVKDESAVDSALSHIDALNKRIKKKKKVASKPKPKDLFAGFRPIQI